MENLNTMELNSENDAMDIISTEKIDNICTEELEKMDIISENENNHEKIFSTFTEFVASLKDSYGNQYHELKLYNLLLENTGIIHVEQREKHVNLLKKYLIDNQLAILEQDVSKLKDNYHLVYSEKIFINLKEIISKNQEDQDAIWEYLLILLALTVPDTKAQNILTTKQQTSKVNVSEDNIFGNLLNNITQQLEQTDLNETNPMALVSSIMNSGMMNDIFQSFSNPNNNGQTPEFDFNQMLNSFQDVMKNLQQDKK